MRRSAQRPFQNQKSQAVNRRPCHILGARPALRRQCTCLHQRVQNGSKQLKWIQPALSCLRAIYVAVHRILRRKRRSEKSRLRQRKFEIARSYCAKTRSCRVGRTLISPDSRQFHFNRARQRRKSSRSDSLQQVSMTREVSIRSVRRNSRPSRRLAKHHRLRSASAR